MVGKKARNMRLLVNPLNIMALSMVIGMLFALTGAGGLLSLAGLFLIGFRKQLYRFGDAELAGSIVMLSTLASAFSYTVILLLLKGAGI